jgi:hypothetical protein
MHTGWVQLMEQSPDTCVIGTAVSVRGIGESNCSFGEAADVHRRLALCWSTWFYMLNTSNKACERVYTINDSKVVPLLVRGSGFVVTVLRCSYVSITICCGSILRVVEQVCPTHKLAITHIRWSSLDGRRNKILSHVVQVLIDTKGQPMPTAVSNKL